MTTLFIEDLAAAALLANVDTMFVGADGSVAVVPARRDDEVIDLLAQIRASIAASHQLSADGGSARRMQVMLLERIAAALIDGAARPWGRGPHPTDRLLTKREAAKFVGVSERGFERHAQRDLTPTRVGRRLFYAVEELETWLAGRKGGASRATHAQAATSFVSRTTGGSTSSARAKEILAELRSPPRGSTPKSSPGLDAPSSLPELRRATREREVRRRSP